MKVVWGLLVLIIMLPAVYGQDMVLLAVEQSGDELRGSTAALSLELNNGNGRIFLETQPLTKADTQVSTRFAAQVACSMLDVSCSNYDFIYTVRSNAPLVGGPSAGAAMTILTIGELSGVDLADDVAISGTINSGGIIGPVGGIKQKIEAAASADMSTVLIPYGVRFSEEDDNSTLDLVAYGDEIGIEVVEVGLITDAFSHFSEKVLFEEVEGELIENSDYTRLMKDVSDQLCNRTQRLFAQVKDPSNVTLDAISDANDAIADGNYYTAASRCFFASIELSQEVESGLTQDVLGEKLNRLEDNVDSFEKSVTSRDLKTMPELQTSMLVLERISETRDLIDLAREQDLEMGIDSYAFARERFSSAVSWSSFFEMSGVELDLDSEVLKSGCEAKLSETYERIQYINSITEIDISGIEDLYARSAGQYKDESYAQCLHTASLTKARLDVILGSMGVKTEDQMRQIIGLKLGVAKKNLILEQQRDLFALAGYSYYQYSQNLVEDEPATALLFAQYALELSSFDAYFTSEQVVIEKKPMELSDGFELFFVYVMGIISGVLITSMVMGNRK